MRRLAFLAAAAAVASGCAARRLMPGPQKAGYAVEIEAPTAAEARRRAVSSFFDLYLSSATQQAQAGTLETKILAKAGSFIVREKRMSAASADGARLRLLVAYTRLGRELDTLGLLRPEGVKGRPKVLVSLLESGPGARADEGRASESLRRHLLERGYAIIDLSDHLNGGKSGRRSGSVEEALAASRKLSADVIVTGAGTAAPLEDRRLEGYASFRAKLSLRAQTSPGLKEVEAFDLEATAVDIEAEAAAGKALSSAGELAGVRLEATLAALYQQRAEFSLVVLNIGGLDRTRQLLEALRGLQPLAAAALDIAAGKDVKLRLFVDRMSADELTAEVLRLREFNLHVRSVEPDFNYVELSSGEVF